MLNLKFLILLHINMRNSIGNYLIISGLILIFITTLWLALYWPVSDKPGLRGIVVWNDPYADYSEPLIIFYLWWVPLILIVSGIILRFKVFSNRIISLLIRDFLFEFVYFFVGIFATGLILLGLLPVINWYPWARIRFLSYGLVLLGFAFYAKEKNRSSSSIINSKSIIHNMTKFVYLTCPVTKSKNKIKLMDKISNILKEYGYTPFKPDTSLSAKKLFKRDVDCLSKSSLIVGEFTFPSHGVGFETGFAFMNDIPIIALVEKKAKLSRIIKGNPKIKIIKYSSENQALEKLRNFLHTM